MNYTIILKNNISQELTKISQTPEIETSLYPVPSHYDINGGFDITYSGTWEISEMEGLELVKETENVISVKAIDSQEGKLILTSGEHQEEYTFSPTNTACTVEYDISGKNYTSIHLPSNAYEHEADIIELYHPLYSNRNLRWELGGDIPEWIHLDKTSGGYVPSWEHLDGDIGGSIEENPYDTPRMCSVSVNFFLGDTPAGTSFCWIYQEGTYTSPSDSTILEEAGDSELYYHFKNLTINVPSGEYTYYLLKDGEEDLHKAIATGLCRVGNIETQRNIEYNNERTYKQYE